VTIDSDEDGVRIVECVAIPGCVSQGITKDEADTCFFADQDYVLYLEHLAENATKFGCAVHAYVLMTNHVHLLLTPQKAESASLLMKHLSQRYVQYVDRTYRRSGKLWEGRSRSCVAQEENYVLACYRYIELNPMRAQMVSHPRHYRWSSYRTNAEGKTSEVVIPHAQYLALGRSETERREAYRSLFRSQLDPETLDEIRLATNGNFALGGDRFRLQVEAALGRKASRGKAGRPPKRRAESLPSGDLFG
jgi:putative transposase